MQSLLGTPFWLSQNSRATTTTVQLLGVVMMWTCVSDDHFVTTASTNSQLARRGLFDDAQWWWVVRGWMEESGWLFLTNFQKKKRLERHTCLFVSALNHQPSAVSSVPCPYCGVAPLRSHEWLCVVTSPHFRGAYHINHQNNTHGWKYWVVCPLRTFSRADCCGGQGLYVVFHDSWSYCHRYFFFASSFGRFFLTLIIKVILMVIEMCVCVWVGVVGWSSSRVKR